MLVRVRVTARNFRRLEPTDQPPKRKGGPPGRVCVAYSPGDELTVSRAFYEKHKDGLRLLGEDSDDAAAPETLDDLEALRAEAEDLGISVDKRWREGRLRDEIEKARAADEDSDPSDPDDEDAI